MSTTAAVRKETLEEVLLRVEALERRVGELERNEGTQAVQPVAASQPGLQTPSLTLSGGAFAIAAKALLGFGGAYLVRAVAESGAVPQALGILAGLVYAILWLAWSTRQNPEDRIAAPLYSLTATLIFAGLVWENSVRFQHLAPAAGALLIACFAGVGMYLARRRNLPAVSGVVRAVCSTLALALLLTTHNMVQFTAAILAIAMAGEFAACREALLNQRWIAAFAADIAVFLTTWVITRPQGLPESYPKFGMPEAVAVQVALLLIYAAALGYRTLRLRTDITHFEIAQNATAIGLFIWGSVLTGRTAAAFCVVAGVACYATAVLFLAKRERLRNFLMYGIFGLVLMVAGVSILFSGVTLVLVWCALATVTAWMGTHEHRMSLQIHSPIYLAAAALASGLIEFAAHALHGAAAPSGARLVEIVLATAALAVCYWLEDIGGSGKARLPAALIAALLCWSLLGLGGAGITSMLGPDSFISNTLRTGLICVVALGLAKIATNRQECHWLIYPLMLYGGYRLLVEDFPNGRPTALALSLLFYGGTLLLLTRMMRATEPHTAR